MMPCRNSEVSVLSSGRRATSADRCYRCYEYVVPEPRVTWTEAHLACVGRGGHLASLETPEEWSAVLRALALRNTAHAVYLGLSATALLRPLAARDR